jgi:hypothetical protein
MSLVVAARLEVQHSYFRLRTSSNTPSVQMNDAHGSFANSNEEMHFPSCNFCLKKRLDEPAQFKRRLPFDELINQSEPTCGLASHTRN